MDAVLTVREFGRLLRMVGVDCAALDEVPFDNPLGLSTGAATIFGRTGGVIPTPAEVLGEIEKMAGGDR